MGHVDLEEGQKGQSEKDITGRLLRKIMLFN